MAGAMCERRDATRVWNRTREMSEACRDERTIETGKPHAIWQICMSPGALEAVVCRDRDTVTESNKCKSAGSSFGGAFTKGLDTEYEARECAHSLNLLEKGEKQSDAKMTERKWFRTNVWTVVVKK